ncbi:phosphotransferase [Brevibacterium samyangense]|uniref:Aminoglycoside phosphotransferase n=1 Tax=Brevibacterium samyangense TaxID=366888 RepID=A0ABN2TEA7_9MICO
MTSAATVTGPSATDTAPATPNLTDPEVLGPRLENRLRAVLGGGASVRDLQILTGGASRLMWRVELDHPEHEKVVLRMHHPSDANPEDNEREARVLAAAHAEGVRSPAVLDFDSTSEVLGVPYVVLSWVDGETIARKVLRDERFGAARSALARDLGEAIARIHHVDPQTLTDAGVRLPHLDDHTGKLRADLEASGIPRPALRLALAELDRTAPAEAPADTLVHGDFRMGNLMIDEAGLAAVLDWEITHTGNPHEDLGYVCMRAWRFGGPGRVAGVGDVEEFLTAYEAAGGVRPSAAALTWWEARATVWWGVGCLRQMQRSVPGHANELELLAIGRRTAEQEYDVLELLYPDVEAAEFGGAEFGAGSVSAAEAEAPTLFTNPTAGEFLAALENYLDTDLVHGTGEPNRFKARVAKNALGVLRREQEARAAADAWFASALAGLGVGSEAELDAHVAGLADSSAQTPEVRELVAVLKRMARLRLEVSNPKYLR